MLASEPITELQHAPPMSVIITGRGNNITAQVLVPRLTGNGPIKYNKIFAGYTMGSAETALRSLLDETLLGWKFMGPSTLGNEKAMVISLFTAMGGDLRKIVGCREGVRWYRSMRSRPSDLQ